MSNLDWRRRLRGVGPEVNKHMGEGVLFWMKSGVATKYGRTARMAKRQRYRSTARSIKHDTDDELCRLRVLCQRQDEELNEKREQNEALQQENDELRQANELLNDRLRYAQDELQVLRFLNTPKAGDDFDAIGPVQPKLLEERGKRIGCYELDHGLLGKGAFGRVWLGRPLSSNAPNHDQEVAIKEFDKSKIQSTRSLSRLNLECAILRHHGNSHQNIIGFSEVIHARESIYLVMEKADASLNTYASSGHHRVQTDFAQQITIGVLNALAYLHRQGISHGDIDPQNILIKRSGGAADVYIGADTVRLCDFGLSHHDAPGQEDQGEVQVCGKPGFMAPEVIQRKDGLDHCKADMWSLGCTLMVLTGRVPDRWYEYYEARNSNPNGFQANIANCVEQMRREQGLEGSNALEFAFLFNGLLEVTPECRLSSDAALKQPWLLAKLALL